MALLPGCGGKQVPPPVAPRLEEPPYEPAPWAWHKVGGVLVVTGELLSPVELTLTGRHMNERIYAESGPIRWEFHAPPAGEVVTLRTIEGKLLAKWNLDVPMPEPQVAQVPPAAPKRATPPVAPVMAKRTEAPWPETHLPLSKGPIGTAPAPVQTWNPCLPFAPQVAARPVEAPWPETHLPLATGRFTRALPRQAAVPPAAPKLGTPPVAPVMAKRAGTQWPETHLPLSKGPIGTAPAPVQTWNPCLPFAPQVAARPVEAPWPETHLPLAKGRQTKALPQQAMVPPAVPKPATPPAAQVMAKRVEAPWPETHLPLSKGPIGTAPAPVQTWNPCLPFAPQVAASPAEAPWPETHLPLARGLFRTSPALPRLAAHSTGPPWPETHLPRSKGLFRIAVSASIVEPSEGLPGAVPLARSVLPTSAFIAQVMYEAWPETHLPQAVGRARSATVATLPAMAQRVAIPAPLLPLEPVQAAPRGTAGPSWPETHLPQAKGLFRLSQSKPVLLSTGSTPSVVLPTRSPILVRPGLALAVNAPWPETHLPLVQGETRKIASKSVSSEGKTNPAQTLPPTPALESAPPLALPGSPAPEWPGQGEAFNLIRGPRGNRWVCITFDGGSSDEVALDVLNALKERGILTTFFLTGDFIGKFPDLVRRIAHEGHEVGNHTMDHPHFAPGGKRDPRWTKERFQQQLLQADAAFLRLAGRPMDPYWRAPYGEQTTELRKWAEELGYRHVAWSEGADTLDWATVKERKLYRTGDAILDRLRDRMERQDGDGLIVLMHLGSARPEGDRPARVLGPFLDQALDGGWVFVNISAYLKEIGKTRWDASSRLAMLTQRAEHP